MQTHIHREPAPVLKVVSANGQISLGKEFAGQQVQVEMREPGVWLFRSVVVVPTNELWLHTPASSTSLERAVAWAQANPARESDLTALLGAASDSKVAGKTSTAA